MIIELDMSSDTPIYVQLRNQINQPSFRFFSNLTVE